MNHAGESIYSEPILFTVGHVPNAPKNLRMVEITSETSVRITWTQGDAITSNPETLAYRVYLDDGSGNEPALFYDTLSSALTNDVTLTGLKTGATYQATVRAVNEIGES